LFQQVSLIKFLVESTDMKKLTILEHVQVGDLVMQGALFKPTKEKFDRCAGRLMTQRAQPSQIAPLRAVLRFFARCTRKRRF
jgi:hypothetical protein